MPFNNYQKDILNFLNDEHVLIYLLTLFTFCSIAILIYIKNKVTFFEVRKLPCARPPSVLFGHIKDVVFQETAMFFHLWKYYNRFKRKGYKFGGIYLFMRPAVLLVDSKLVQQVLLDEGHELVDRKEKRKLSKMFLEIFNEQDVLNNFVINENEHLQNLINSLKQGGDVQINEILNQSLMKFMVKLIGLEYDNDNVIQIFKQLIDDNTETTFMKMFFKCYPIYKQFKFWNKRKKYMNCLIKQCDMVMDYRKKNDIKNIDLIQNFMKIMQEDENVADLLKIIVNCSQTVHNTILFCLMELVMNMEVQEELIGEIRRFKNNNKIMNLENLNKLVYLDTVVKETFRKYPPCSTIMKECKEYYKLVDEKSDLPPTTYIILSVYGIHHDSNNFINPEIFDPDRFSEENKMFIKPYSFIPFGTYSSSEIEMELSSVVTKLFIMEILSNFSIGYSKSFNSVLGYSKNTFDPYPQTPVYLNFKLLNDTL